MEVKVLFIVFHLSSSSLSTPVCLVVVLFDKNGEVSCRMSFASRSSWGSRSLKEKKACRALGISKEVISYAYESEE